MSKIGYHITRFGGFMVRGKVSKHALSRMIERNVMSQNIKPNKKQIKRHTNKALKYMRIDLNNSFGSSISEDGQYVYYYCSLRNTGKCKKYVLSRFSGDIITLIKDVLFERELKKNKIILKGYGHETKHFNDMDYVYKTISNNDYLFVINPLNKMIYSCNYLRGQ